MKQSDLFSKTTKDNPKDEVSKNAQLLIRAGFVYKEMAGVYAYLPLGLRVLENIKRIIAEEMTSLGASELSMTSLQRKELWEVTNRWDDEKVDVWFKSKLKNDTEVGFAWSHEEPITDMLKNYIHSYKDLPVYVFQFQNKLRNELRAKSGIMRGREFLMKDMYSYSLDAKQHDDFYNRSIDAYMNVFTRCGLGDITYVTHASGGAFTEFSHEFQTITDAGEDVIYINRDKNIAINEEVLNDTTLSEMGITRDDLEEVKTAEVGNIFNFSTGKCEDLGLFYTNEAGEKIPVHLGSYGIGINRVMGVMVEHFGSNDSMVWPVEVSPYQLHLIAITKTEEDQQKVQELYSHLQESGYTVLLDDRDVRAGQKFADADLIGIPNRLIVSSKTLENNELEFTDRTKEETQNVSLSDLSEFVKNYV